MSMSNSEIILSVIIALLIGLFAAYLFWAQRKFTELEAQLAKPATGVNSGLQLSAYERLALLTERLKLNHLASRLTQSGWSARELQQAMLITIREEFDHNITQQLYVKKEIWDAVQKMKEQNSFIIHKIVSTLPQDATALDLSKMLVQFDLDNPEATLNQLVLDAIRHETRQLL